MDRIVRTGIDRLPDLNHPMLSDRRIGIVTGPTGITADFRSTIEVCAGLASAKIAALFACEHGLYGERQAGETFGDEFEPYYGVPVYSLYGERRKPTSDMLEPLDTVIFDMQDTGVRFYTYLSTLFYVIEACAEYGKSLLVLDRPNPLGGLRCEGGLLVPGFESMVGAWTMPIRTGMTIGELAGMYNAERQLGCELEVVWLEGWNRRMEFQDTGLPWLMPSPNMPTMDTVRTYAGTCLLEGTNVSEGRGTTKPFEWIGAPWIDGRKLAGRMKSYGLPGIHFHPMYASPVYSKYKGQKCGGVQLFVTDPKAYQPVHTGLVLLHELSRQYPEHFEWLKPAEEGRRCFIDLLTGSDEVRKNIAKIYGLEHIISSWSSDVERWKRMREPYLRYEEGLG
ncbi:exo-beta-N-acetylmuramidase NamZ domain-containing protein [Marinicrinis lubricantis]|uniref:Exo-beta-N-acetylmuramidase NamZ domain-containing protein n=1 Tax=Marinicrinis lubricantis TaxID=2086470 RepID=A0ABW1IRB5_9BACL